MNARDARKVAARRAAATVRELLDRCSGDYHLCDAGRRLGDGGCADCARVERELTRIANRLDGFLGDM